MTLTDIIHETYGALTANKVRSGLTMLGIIIGISSVIAMTAIGAGAQNSINSSISAIGSNLLMITPGAQRNFGGPSGARGDAQTITIDDGKAIQSEIPNIAHVSFNVTSRQQVVTKGYNTNTSIIGTTPSYADTRNVSTSDGVFLSESHITEASKVAVIGPTVVTDLFPDNNNPVGETIRIKGMNFKIIGITTTKGSSGFSNADDAVYIPYTTAQRYLSGNRYLGGIDVSAESSKVTTQIQDDITSLLMERHHITDTTKADFSILNQADIAKTASSVTSTLTILLGAVAGISLLVGGIGIMNMMLTTVTERTKEIGLRKAIGAKASDISTQFLIEAVMLTFTGGFLGIILGWGIAYGITSLGILQASVSLNSVLLAFGVSTVIGIIFGYYPARRASKLNPIEALRYE